MQLFNAMDEDKKGFLTREVFLELSVILHGYKFCVVNSNCFYCKKILRSWLRKHLKPILT
jgi:hypothetical protein